MAFVGWDPRSRGLGATQEEMGAEIAAQTYVEQVPHVLGLYYYDGMYMGRDAAYRRVKTAILANTAPSPIVVPTWMTWLGW